MNSLTVIFVVIALMVAGMGLGIYKVIIPLRNANRQALLRRFERIRLLYDRLESGHPVTQLDVYDYAKDVVTREQTFHLLRSRNLLDLFPEEFYSIEKGAESNLVNWLEFPTELGVFPDEIEYLKKVTLDLVGQSRFVHYYVFKFKVYQPHWASGSDWMLGVVGPYFDNSAPYDHPRSTFSRLHNKIFDINLPDEEAKWVHENISLLFGSRPSR